MWAGHGPIDLRRALAVSCNPYFEWVGEQLGYATIQRYAHLLGPRRCLRHQPDRRDGGLPAGLGAPGRRGSPLEPRRGRRDFRRAARGAGLGAINGGVVLQPESRDPRTSSRTSAGGCPRARASTGSPQGFLGAVNEGSASPAFDPGRGGGRKDRHLLGARLVRVLRSRGPPGAGGGGVPAPRQRPRGVGGRPAASSSELFATRRERSRSGGRADDAGTPWKENEGRRSAPVRVRVGPPLAACRSGR